MDKEKLDRLQGKVGDSLSKQINDLEEISRDLENDLRMSSPGAERDKNQALLTAAQTLLRQLKEAQTNITRLIDNNR